MNTSAVIFIGRPGSGKGTQAKMLAAKLGWKLYSSGEHFKQLVDSAGPLSEEIRKDYDQGHLSPDWLAAYFFEEAILDLDHKAGIICEGFPRSLPQAHLADQVFTWLERPYQVVLLKVNEEIALQRQLDRAKVEDRPDSNSEEKVRTRFHAYTTRTEPLLEFFKEKGKLIEVDGEKDPEEIAREIGAALTL